MVLQHETRQNARRCRTTVARAPAPTTLRRRESRVARQTIHKSDRLIHYIQLD